MQVPLSWHQNMLYFLTDDVVYSIVIIVSNINYYFSFCVMRLFIGSKCGSTMSGEIYYVESEILMMKHK